MDSRNKANGKGREIKGSGINVDEELAKGSLISEGLGRNDDNHNGTYIPESEEEFVGEITELIILQN